MEHSSFEICQTPLDTPFHDLCCSWAAQRHKVKPGTRELGRGPLPRGSSSRTSVLSQPPSTTMVHLSGVPVRPNPLRYPLAVSTSSRFSFGAPEQRTIKRATAAQARHRRPPVQPNRARRIEGASRPPSVLLDDDNEHEELMGRKGRKGKGAAAGGSAGMKEATLVRVSKALEDFRASNAEGSHHSPPFILAPVFELRSGKFGAFERV